MASATLAADGVTVTIPFTGTCVSPLSPTSGILGFAADNGSAGLAVASVTSSGCTVTVTFGRPVNVEETPHVDLSSATGAGYLTDASGNTPTGQSSFSVSNGTEWHQIAGASMSGKYMAEGSHYDSSGFPDAIEFLGPGGDVSTSGADGCVRINATANALDLFVFNYTSHWVLRSGGTQLHDWGSIGATTWTEQGLVSGLSGTKEYDFCQDNPAAGYSDAWEIRVTGTINAAPARKPLIIAGGDSLRQYWSGTDSALTDATLGDVYQVAQQFGMADQFVGWAGFSVCGGSGGLEGLIPYQFGTVSASEVFKVALIAWSSGGNDVSAGATPAQLGACWTTMLASINALTNPPEYIIAEGLPPEVTPYAGTYDAAIAAACAAVSNCRFVHTASPAWVNTTICAGEPGGSSGGDRHSDQIHICGAAAGSGIGYAKVATYREIPLIAGILNGASYQFSSSTTTGIQGTAITGFTVAPVSGAAFSGDQTVTLSDSGHSGAFSCTGASGTGSVTLTPAVNSTVTCSYTSIVTGTVNLIATNGQDNWLNPSSIPLTISAEPATGTYFLMGKK
jgi:hypothetical protein